MPYFLLSATHTLRALLDLKSKSTKDPDGIPASICTIVEGLTL